VAAQDPAFAIFDSSPHHPLSLSQPTELISQIMADLDEIVENA
jgi:hypothetical protein